LGNVVNITTTHIQDYLVRQMARGVKLVTLNGHVCALNAIFRFLQKEDLCKGAEPPTTKSIRHEKRILETFSESQIAKVLKACDNGGFTGLRDKTAIMLMLETGVQASELTNIKLQDVNIPSGSGEGIWQRTQGTHGPYSKAHD
jgi:integrase/recombinase XerD